MHGGHGNFQRLPGPTEQARRRRRDLRGAGPPWAPPAEPTVLSRRHGAAPRSPGGRSPRGAGLPRGRGPFKEGAWPARGRGLRREVARGVRGCRAFKPGLARPERAFAAARRPPPAARRPPPAARRPPPARPPQRPSRGPSCRRASAMPRYELALILKVMQRPETAAALKRTIEALMDRGAVVRNLENLGERALPYRISAHSQRHTRGGYFLVDFYSPTTTVESMMEHLSRDIDVIRRNIVRHPLTQEVKACEGIVPVPLEEKLYSTKKRK
nr:28S ribosomal protein S6, mitochondrial [Pipistrellus kuhlii]